MQGVLERALEEAQGLLREFRDDPSNLASVAAIAEAILGTFQSGHKVLACGNGGSMADAMHFAEEWTGRFRADREPYPAIALGDPTHMSCVANDYGFEHVFARQVRALGRPGDILLLLSTSGSSPSILEAAKAGRERRMTVAGLLGKGGGEALALCDLALVAPGQTSDRIQELHMLCLHAVIEAVEGALEASPR